MIATERNTSIRGVPVPCSHLGLWTDRGTAAFNLWLPRSQGAFIQQNKDDQEEIENLSRPQMSKEI